VNAVWEQLIFSTKTGRKYTLISDFDPSDKRLGAGETVTQLCLGHVALQGSAVAVAVEQRQ
jgi:hypothetical protein